MEEQLISIETAKLAKKKGFNIPCENFYITYIDDDVADLFNYEEQRGSGFAELYRNNKEFKFSAPTQSLLQKWLREVHNIHITITIYNCSVKTTFYRSRITYFKDNLEQNKYRGLGEYKQAFEIGLQEALKLI